MHNNLPDRSRSCMSLPRACVSWLPKVLGHLKRQRGTWLGPALAAHCSAEAIACCGDLQTQAFHEAKRQSSRHPGGGDDGGAMQTNMLSKLTQSWDWFKSSATVYGAAQSSSSLSPPLLSALVRAMELQAEIYKEAGQQIAELVPVLQVEEQGCSRWAR